MSQEKTIYFEKDVKARNREMWYITAVLCFITFITGFYFCKQTYYEFPLSTEECYEGYHARPLCGHYVEFIDSFITKEEYYAKFR